MVMFILDVDVKNINVFVAFQVHAIERINTFLYL